MMVWQWLSSFEALALQRTVWLFPFVLGNKGITISQCSFSVMALKKEKIQQQHSVMFWDLVLPSHQLPCSIAPRVGVGYLEVWLHHLVKAWLGQGMALASALVLQRKELSNEGTVSSGSN